MRFIHKNQRGYTLIEVLVAVAITGIIAGGLAMSIYQVITIEARTSNHMTAVRQVQNAGYWISRDTQMSQDEPVIVKVPVPGEPDKLQSITLTWTEYEEDGATHTAIYTLDSSELSRTYDAGQPMPVAQYIDLNIDPNDPSKRLTDCEFTGGKLTLTVTATVSVGWLEGRETRVYEVIPRPDEIYH